MPGPDGVIDSAGPYALRRLTKLEYQNSLRDLLGTTVSDDDKRGFAADQVLSGGFSSGAGIVTSVDSRQLLDVSSKLADAAMADLGKLLPAGCAAPAADAEQGCVDQVIEEFGLRAFRRPPTAEEMSGLTALYTKLRGAEVGATWARRARRAAGHPAVAAVPVPLGAGGRSPIKDGHLISWALRDRLAPVVFPVGLHARRRAVRGGQGRRAGPARADRRPGRRMLGDERAKAGMRDFHMQWLDIYGIAHLEKDEIFTTYSPEVAKAMLGETSAFVDASS